MPGRRSIRAVACISALSLLLQPSVVAEAAAFFEASAVTGPWTPAGKQPESFQKLPAEDSLLTGEPTYTNVPGTRLLWVSNTESDVFRLGTTGPMYYLVAGRWFAAPDFTGPWAFTTPSLPADFKQIPLEGDDDDDEWVPLLCSVETTGRRRIATRSGRAVRRPGLSEPTKDPRYAGNDGNVYRRDGDTWQKSDNGDWSNTDRQPGDRPRGTSGQLSGNDRPSTMDGVTSD